MKKINNEENEKIKNVNINLYNKIFKITLSNEMREKMIIMK
jgi:hypothetical protein